MVFWSTGRNVSIKDMNSIAMCLVGFLFILFGSVLVLMLWGLFIQATRVKCVKCESYDVIPIPNTESFEGQTDLEGDCMLCTNCGHVWSPIEEASHPNEVPVRESVQA